MFCGSNLIVKGKRNGCCDPYHKVRSLAFSGLKLRHSPAWVCVIFITNTGMTGASITLGILVKSEAD